MTDFTPTEEPAGKPKFDIGTVLLSVARRWYIILLILPIALGSGWFVGHKLGKDSYQSETILLYSQSADSRDATDPKTEILTLKDTVKLPEYLAETIARLHLKTTPEILGKATDVEVGKNTTLMSISAKWDSPEQTAAICNTLRDVFLQGVQSRVDGRSNSMTGDLQRRLDDVRVRQKAADARLASFISTNQIVDIDKQAKSLLDQYNEMTILLEQAQADKTTVQQQTADLDNAVDRLKKSVSSERNAMATMESTGDVGIRIDRLREMINDDRAHRANLTQLAYLKSQLDRVKKLYDAGAVSEARYQEALTQYQKQDAVTNDTTQIELWKKQLAALQKQIAPPKPTTTPSGALLQTMVQKTFDIQLQKVAVVERARYLDGQRNKVKLQLDRIPLLQRQYVVLTRDCDTLDQERKSLETKLSVAQDMSAHQGASFTLVSAADVPDAPLKSSKKTMILGLSAFLIILGVGGLFALELLDHRIKSPSEVRLLFEAPLLCAIPHYRKNSAPFPGDARSPIGLQLSGVARRIRQQLPGETARIVILGVGQGDGVTTIAANLAATFGRQDEIVLLIDAQQYPHANCRQLQDLLEGERSERGLAEFLAEPADDLAAVATRTSMPGVQCLPHNGREIVPDWFGSRRMGDLLTEAGKTYSTILIDAPPLLTYVESELLVQKSDGVVLVVRSEKTLISDIEKALEKLAETGKPVLGIVLNGVNKIYLKRE